MSARLARRTSKLALFQERHRARHLGLVHVGVGADRLAGHHAVLAERHQHPPFRHADPVAPRIDARQRLGDEARHDVELIGQELLELQRRLFGGRRRGLPAIAFYRALNRHPSPHHADQALAGSRLSPPRRSDMRMGRIAAKMNELDGPRNGWVGRVGAVGGSGELQRRSGAVRKKRRRRGPSLKGQREHSMATKLSQLPPLQVLGSLVGMAPVMSSRSTLRNDSACANCARLAIGACHRRAARRARSEAAVDAVAVAVIGDDEHPLFGLRRGGSKKHGRGGADRNHETHRSPTRRTRAKDPTDLRSQHHLRMRPRG